MIGESVHRVEDQRLVTGHGCFVDDVRFPDMLHLVILRSTHARARISVARQSDAQEVKGASAFFFEDLPELKRPLPLFREPATNPYCDFIAVPDQYVLAKDEVRYVGEPIAAIVADSQNLALDAAESIEIAYDPLPPILDPEAAMVNGTDRVHAGIENMVAHLKAEIGEVDAGFRDADIVVEERLHYPRVASMPIETRGACARFDPSEHCLTVWVGHQIPYALKEAVAAVTGLRAQDVRVRSVDTGGAFGPKSNIYSEDLLVPLLAFRLRRPVKWIQTRSEFMLSSQQARDQFHDARLAATRDGNILALDVRIVKDTGSYLCWAVIEPTNTVNHLISQYRIPAYRAEAFSVLTNKVPSAPYRGTGRPEACFVTERMLDILATRLGRDPLDLRLQNMIKPEDMPFRSGLAYRDGIPIAYDGGDYPANLRRAAEIVDYPGWRRKQAGLRREGRRIGLGLAPFMEASGIGWPCEGATVKVDTQGNVEVFIGVSSSGQGHETVFAQICAAFIGVRCHDIRVSGGDTNLLPVGFGTGGSRVTVNTGNAVAAATKIVATKARRVAARLLQCSEAEVRIEDSRAFAVGARNMFVTLAEIAGAALVDKSLAALGGPGLQATEFYYPRTVTWTNGVHAVVVEVLPETGEWKILNYAIVHDCGRQINPKLVEGQVLGGFTQGLGVALGERLVYDDAGQLLTGSFMDYAMPRAMEVPSVVIEHREFDAGHNPLNVRGVGEGNTAAPTAAVANAIADALEGKAAIRSPVLTAPIVYRLAKEGGIA